MKVSGFLSIWPSLKMALSVTYRPLDRRSLEILALCISNELYFALLPLVEKIGPVFQGV